MKGVRISFALIDMPLVFSAFNFSQSLTHSLIQCSKSSTSSSSFPCRFHRHIRLSSRAEETSRRDCCEWWNTVASPCERELNIAKWVQGVEYSTVIHNYCHKHIKLIIIWELCEMLWEIDSPPPRSNIYQKMSPSIELLNSAFNVRSAQPPTIHPRTRQAHEE